MEEGYRLEYAIIEPTLQPNKRRLTSVILVGALVSAALAATLAFGHAAAIDLVGLEAYKTLLQFVLIVVLGGGVSLLHQVFQREADARTEFARQNEARELTMRQARQRYLTELITQYNSVKRARRVLRAHALIRSDNLGDPRIKVSKYDELMQAILDAQLSLETLAHGIRAEPLLFPPESRVSASVSTAETYLRALITEWEEVLPTIESGREAIDLASLPRIADFIGPYQELATFRLSFVHPYQDGLAAVQRLIIDLEPPR